MRKGFTLVEMLVVMGIIAILVGASITGFSKITRAAENTKCNELVYNVATAMATIYQQQGAWPRRIVAKGDSESLLDADAAVALKGYLSLNVNDDGKLVGLDRLGVITPWATAVLKRVGKSASPSTKVPGGDGQSTLEDHILRYAVDSDGDGIVTASVGGEAVNIRGVVAVWCCGRDGKIESYSVGRRKDDIYSWTPGQVQE